MISLLLFAAFCIAQPAVASPNMAKLGTELGYILQPTPFAEQFPDLVVAFSGFLRNDAQFSSRQMVRTAGAYINTAWPMQPESDILNSRGGDFLDHPSASTINILPSINVSLGGMRMFGADISLLSSTSFVGFDFGNGIAILSNTFAQWAWEHQSFAIGKMPHPLMKLICYPNVVENEFGTPITPFALANQMRYERQFGNYNLDIGVFSQYEFSSDGPLQFPFTFLNYYQRNSLAPGIYLSGEYQQDDYLIGGGVAIYRLRPRLYTQPKTGSVPAPERATVATGEHIVSTTWTAYASMSTRLLYACTQLLFGENGTPWTNLGGYGVSSINSFDDQRAYTNIRYFSWWADFNFLELQDSNFQPGLYIGITKNRGSKQPIVTDPSTGLPLVYTIDGYVDFIAEAFGALPKKFLMSLIRVSPRVWVYFNRNLVLGIEMTTYRTTYAAQVDTFFKPTVAQTTTSWTGVASLQYLF